MAKNETEERGLGEREKDVDRMRRQLSAEDCNNKGTEQ